MDNGLRSIDDILIIEEKSLIKIIYILNIFVVYRKNFLKKTRRPAHYCERIINYFVAF